MALPASLRVPRSPSVFVGRECDLARAAEVLDRSGVVVLTGLGGLGKTSLACRLVEVMGASSTALLVGVSPGAHLVLEIGRTLARAGGFATADWSGFASDPTTMLDAVIELAEASARVVVVDDLHEAAVGGGDVIHRISRACRHSRWIVTSRGRPTWPGSEEQVVAVDPLDAGDVESMVAACAPELADDERRSIVQAAAGSPWRARARLRGACAAVLPTDGLDPRAMELLALLLAVTVAVPAPLLEELGALDDRTLDVLDRHGFLRPGVAQLRLHDVARAQLEGGALPLPPAERLVRFAEVLWASGDPELELEAVGLVRRHAPDHAALVDRCATRVEAWVEAGLAERVLAILEGSGAPAALAACLGCAAAIGTDEALAFATSVREPTTPDAKLWWAVAHERAGHLAVAGRAAREVREATDDADRAARAGLVEASALRAAGRPHDAEQVIARLAPVDRALRVLVEARHASVMALLGRAEEALAQAQRALQHAESSPPGPRLDVFTTVQSMLSNLGHLAQARALARRIESERIRAPFASRQQLASRCIDALEAGELAVGRRWLDQLGPTRSSAIHVQALLHDVRWRGAVGRFDGIEEALAELSDLCETSGNAEGLAWARLAEAFFGVVLGRDTLSPWPPQVHAPHAQLAAAMNAWVRIAQRRNGVVTAAAPEVDCPIVDLSLFLRRDTCEARLLGGDVAGARRDLRGMIELARRYGYELHLADLLALGVDIHLADRDAGEAGRRAARHLAHDLAVLAARIGSERYALEAELGALLASDGGAAADRLEPIAAAGSVSPVSARRARSLLGGVARLDAVDRLVLGAGPIARRAPAGDEGAWQFDPASRRVLLPARVVELQRHGLLARLLGTLVERGEAGATKEELTRIVWDLRDYHPLRDDKRLQMTVRRLRVMVEEDADRPRRVVTTDDGYAVRGVATRPV